ncbi:hypothetical protein Asp14428_54180 [Actinoplanes sp. NBRC 14428]|nr:hypothetical protein Asp14428_54180 [Actinoplanes sp. NBRC 14428]
MNVRLSRPLLAVAVSGALLAGGALGASPAFASDPRDSTAAAHAALGDEPAGDDPSTPPVVEPTTPEPSGEPSEPPASEDPAPDPTEPTTPAPDPTTEPTTDPSAPTPDPDPTTPDPGPVSPSPSPDPLDVTAPVGRFSLSATSLWIGQRVTLTQGAISDDTSGPDQISRVVSWGDGTSSTLYAGQAPVKKQYTRNGRYTITVTLRDAAGNTGKAVASSNTVSVTTPGKFKLDKYSVWPGQTFKFTISNVPAGTTKIWLNTGDGYNGAVSGRNQSVTGVYYHHKNGGLVRGKVTIRATFYNKNGASSSFYAAQLTVKKDSWKPTLKVKKPSKANRLKSWKYATGTVKDKGAGVPYVFVWATRINGNAVYCFTPRKTWKRVYSEEEYNNCAPVAVKPSKGKWSLRLKGLKKGTLYIDARAFDWGDNGSKWASVSSKITRS